MLHRSTIFLSVIALLLALLTSVVIWQLYAAGQEAPQPHVEGAVVGVGLPSLKPTQVNRHFSARSSLIWDSEAQVIRFEQNGFERLPIASLTKLMTAIVAIDHGIDWEVPATIELTEYGLGGQLLLHPGENVTMRDLFTASLVGSANNATLAYVRQLPMDRQEFVQAMNRKAIALGLEQTHFVEVTGLDKDNISTAYDMARLAEHAFTHYPEIAAASSAREYAFTVQGSGRTHTIKNTNKLISEHGDTYLGSKTGYLDEARYCLVVRGAGSKSNRIVIILGSPSEQEHFADIRRLVNDTLW